MSDVAMRLRERRTRVWDEMTDVAGNAADENRPLSETEEKRYVELQAELGGLDERIGQIIEGEKRAREVAASFADMSSAHQSARAQIRTRGQRLNDPDVDEQFRRAIIDKNPAPIELYPSERRSWYQPGVEARALTKGTATQALPVDVYDRVLMHLVENSAIMAAGATVINTETGENLQVPRSSAFSTSALTTEGAAATLSDATLGIATLGAFKYMNSFQISRELATDSQSNILDFLVRQAAVSLALAYGPHLITGTGGGTQPQGVVTAAGTGVTGPVGTTVSLGSQTTAGMGTDLLYSLIASVAEPYARQPGTGFVLTNASLGIVRKLKDSTGQPVAGMISNGIRPSSGAPEPNSILGYPANIDPSMAQMAANAKSIVFGDFSRYFVRIASGIRFERSDEFAFTSDLVTFRCIIRLDGQMVDANGLKLFVNSAT